MNSQSSSVDQFQPAYSVLEERLNALSHLLGMLLAIAGLVYLLIESNNVLAVTTSAIYGSTLIAMFLASTIYHSVSHVEAKKFFKLLDHCAIYLLIAGTYTPLVTITIGGWIGWTALIAIWCIALFGLVFKFVAGSKYPKVSLFTYLLMGWLAIFLAYPFYLALPASGLMLLVAGGLCFSFGVFFYTAKTTRFTHVIWHLFVIAGCACHYFTIYFFVL